MCAFTFIHEIFAIDKLRRVSPILLALHECMHDIRLQGKAKGREQAKCIRWYQVVVEYVDEK